jgi:hypothetical protein
LVQQWPGLLLKRRLFRIMAGSSAIFTKNFCDFFLSLRANATMRDFRLPPPCKWGLLSSWIYATYIGGKLPTDCPERRHLNSNLHCVKSHTYEDLKYQHAKLIFPRHFPTESLPLHHPWIILLSETILPELPTASWNHPFKRNRLNQILYDLSFP